MCIIVDLVVFLVVVIVVPACALPLSTSGSSDIVHTWTASSNNPAFTATALPIGVIGGTETLKGAVPAAVTDYTSDNKGGTDDAADELGSASAVPSMTSKPDAKVAPSTTSAAPAHGDEQSTSCMRKHVLTEEHGSSHFAVVKVVALTLLVLSA
jgi:hypothetical protein